MEADQNKRLELSHGGTLKRIVSQAAAPKAGLVCGAHWIEAPVLRPGVNTTGNFAGRFARTMSSIQAAVALTLFAFVSAYGAPMTIDLDSQPWPAPTEPTRRLLSPRPILQSRIDVNAGAIRGNSASAIP
jgi:hypothetical protein